MAVPVKANQIITIAELDLFLGLTIGVADTSNLLINIASDFMDRFCNRSFIQATYTQQAYDGDGSCQIYLNQYPIKALPTAFTFVSWDTVSNILSTTFTENTEYIVYREEGILFCRFYTAMGHKNYRVTYTAGYAIADIPYDLKWACSKLCELTYFNKGKSGISSETIGSYSVSFDKGNFGIDYYGIPIDPAIAGILMQYRKRNI